MNDAALEEVMEWLVERTGKAVKLQYIGGGHWTGEVWENGEWNYPSGGNNALAAAYHTWIRIAGRTDPRLSPDQIEAEKEYFEATFGLEYDSDGRLLQAQIGKQTS